MPRLPLELPTIQNWNCHNCGGCCREHAISITPEEKSRIESQGWDEANGVPKDQPLFVEERHWRTGEQIRLAHQPDGACVFLDERGFCRIHARFGEAAKPLACRIYPYAFHPDGKQLAVSLRFSCPSVAENRGKPVASQRKAIRELADEVVPARFAEIPPPPLTARTRVDWADVRRVVAALDESFADDQTPFPLKLLRTLCWVDLLAQAKLSAIQGDRLEELLMLLREASAVEVPELPPLAAPSNIAKTQFRLLAGQYARKDTEATMDRTWSGRLRQAAYGWTLARGRGNLPAIHPELPAIPFESLTAKMSPLSEATDEMLTRYVRVKLQGMHFCGRAYYDVSVIEGFYSLALVYPVLLWLARWRAAGQQRDQIAHEDILFALTLADHQHGYSPIFGTWGFRRRVMNLSTLGEIPKLIVWMQRA